MIVTYIYSSNVADQNRVQVRCRNFADAINRLGAHSANLLDLNSFLQNTPEAQAVCVGSDLIVIHRYLYGPVLRAVQYWKARDKKVVVDFDQALNYLSPGIQGYSFWMEGVPLEEEPSLSKEQMPRIDPIPFEQFKWGLGLVDAAIVSSARLADDWAHFTNVIEIPDYINIDQYPALHKDYEDEINIGLCNSTKYSRSNNSGLLKVLEEICRKNARVKLVLCDLESTEMDKLGIPLAQVLTYSSSSVEEWASILPRLDIGVFSITGDYDLRCSRLTLLEFMVSKIPWIASDLAIFRPLASYGTLVQNSSEDWDGALMHVIERIDLYRKKAAGEPFLFALSQDINGNIDKVLRLYTTIINQL
ncbi:MAG: hypothetical protein WCK35_13665 [Chloroflexota bacterium]